MNGPADLVGRQDNKFGELLSLVMALEQMKRQEGWEKKKWSETLTENQFGRGMAEKTYGLQERRAKADEDRERRMSNPLREQEAMANALGIPLDQYIRGYNPQPETPQQKREQDHYFDIKKIQASVAAGRPAVAFDEKKAYTQGVTSINTEYDKIISTLESKKISDVPKALDATMRSDPKIKAAMDAQEAARNAQIDAQIAAMNSARKTAISRLGELYGKTTQPTMTEEEAMALYLKEVGKK